MSPANLNKLSSRIKNLLGRRFGRLVVIAYAGSTQDKKNAQWRCRCDCGTELIVRATCFGKKPQVSCGCYSKQISTTHGLTNSREYKAWCKAKRRCQPGHEHRRYYHDRGIAMCKEWVDDFRTFYYDMGTCPSGHTLDRKDNDRGYEPGNCRWATHKEQCNNRGNNYLITHNGITINLNQWAERTGIQAGTIAHRLRAGWPACLALNSDISISQARKITKQIHQGK